MADPMHEKRVERTNQALFRIAKALHHHRELNALLSFITHQVRTLLGVDGASVILIDEEKQEFYFPVAAYEDQETGKRMREIRFPADKGVASHVYRTGKPLIVHDTAKSPYFFHQVDEQSDYQTRNMLDVPLDVNDRMIGVLCAVNKKDSPFDQRDIDLLLAVASLVALPVENARIHQQLMQSYESLRNLNRAKDRVIHHLSHELKTPVAVLFASLRLLDKRLRRLPDTDWQPIARRAERNLARILDLQYKIEDMLRQRDYRAYGLMNTLLDACQDELEALSAEHPAAGRLHSILKEKVEALFGPREAAPQIIALHSFAAACLESLKPDFAHRRLQLLVRFDAVDPIAIPAEVLDKIIRGLVRNAVEHTPDGGRVRVAVTDNGPGPQLSVRDYGVGITAEKQRLLFHNYFSAGDPGSYTSKRPFEFDAGGKGFDLLRLTLFSERYHFKVQLYSERCRYIPRDSDRCPGTIAACSGCHSAKTCHDSGGTSVNLVFQTAGRGSEMPARTDAGAPKALSRPDGPEEQP